MMPQFPTYMHSFPHSRRPRLAYIFRQMLKLAEVQNSIFKCRLLMNVDFDPEAASQAFSASTPTWTPALSGKVCQDSASGCYNCVGVYYGIRHNSHSEVLIFREVSDFVRISYINLPDNLRQALYSSTAPAVTDTHRRHEPIQYMLFSPIGRQKRKNSFPQQINLIYFNYTNLSEIVIHNSLRNNYDNNYDCVMQFIQTPHHKYAS